MTRFTVSTTLFGDSCIFYMDPISGKQKQRTCNPDDLGANKDLILQHLIRTITSRLYFDRSKVYDFLQKSNPHHITPAFRKTLTKLRVSVNSMFSHDTTKSLASYVSIYIIPDLLCKDFAPSEAKPEAERYFYLANELEKITHEILNPDLSINSDKMSIAETAHSAL
ncbi:MAG: hypothetical protein M1445_06330 [Bacteroidetes bacterium]|nr:hypothetical protein [Bacteroidota bacterium]